MDLSARVLLLGHKITLLSHPKNADLYKNDSVFSAVFSDPWALIRCLGRGYFDLVICDAYSPRVFVWKLLVAPRTPFVGLYSYINGFEVHRTYFAYARMRELLSIDRAIGEIRPTIALPDCLSKAPATDVCVAVGGEWSFRTYDHWLPIVQWLVDQGLTVTLVGSENGIEKAEFLTSCIPSVHSTVGKLSLPEVIGQIAASKAFIGADGGLWHVACSIPLPTVVLFADCQIFNEEGKRVTRETTDMVCETLYNDDAVSQIPYRSVIEACGRLFARIEL
ncbi:MAG: glycosyltransferase family 9 protein [Pseudomonadota bacterium]|nr:glycosyltransferase family 9 protein [Pseudomonadota bacterium]